jgi:hypothetical protein
MAYKKDTYSLDDALSDDPTPWTFDVQVLQSVGKVTGGKGTASPMEAAFALIAHHNEQQSGQPLLFESAEYSFEMPHSPRCTVTITWSDE